MFLEILSKEDVEQIHCTSMRLLEQVGVEFPHEPALATFGKHGVRVDGSRVHLTEDQVMRAVADAPGQFTIHARNPERSVRIGNGHPAFAPGYGAPFLVDPAAGKRTPAMDDYTRLVKIVHGLPNQDLSGHLLVEPGDLEPGTAHLHMLSAHMLHSDKPFFGSAAGSLGAQHTMEMAEILFGGVGDRAVTVSLINSRSPLAYSSEMLEALIAYAQSRQPVIIAALMMAGSTGPVTLAGVLAAQTAELLAGITLAQLASPGTPVVFGSTSTNVDMKSGALAIGSPELSQLVAAHAQLARHYGLPSRSGGALTDASYPDAQAGFESMLGMLTTVHSGVDLVLHAAGILGSFLALSYEKLVLDDEICGMVRRLRQRIDVTPETLAYEVVAGVGPGGNFLAEPHTVRRCRREFWKPAVCDRDGLEAWMREGRRDAVARARVRWQALLAEHQDPPLDALTARQLREYVQEHAARSA